MLIDILTPPPISQVFAPTMPPQICFARLGQLPSSKNTKRKLAFIGGWRPDAYNQSRRIAELEAEVKRIGELEPPG